MYSGARAALHLFGFLNCAYSHSFQSFHISVYCQSRGNSQGTACALSILCRLLPIKREFRRHGACYLSDAAYRQSRGYLEGTAYVLPMFTPSAANQEGIQKARLVYYPSNADYCQSSGNSEGSACTIGLMPSTASQEGIQKARHIYCLSNAEQKGIQKAWYARSPVINSKTRGI